MIDRYFEWVSDALGTKTCAALFVLVAFVPLTYGLPKTVLEWQLWLSNTFLQLVLLAVIQKGGKVTEKRIIELLQETHDISSAEREDIRQELEILRGLALAKEPTNARS